MDPMGFINLLPFSCMTPAAFTHPGWSAARHMSESADAVEMEDAQDAVGVGVDHFGWMWHNKLKDHDL